MATIKQQLFQLCIEFIDARIANCENAIAVANASINEDTKSSAGDKYETSREMMTQEIKNNSTQLAEAIRQKQLLLLIHPDKKSDIVQPGSVVYTNQANFFVAISAGTLKVDGRGYFVLSPSSPLGGQLIDKRKGDTVQFNGKAYVIQDVE